jgi:peptidoglycan/xylan/chitin deacetylase (PgdA/CDA1 family)
MELPILMYHYVRPDAKRLSARHNVLQLDLFLKQLEVIRKKFSFITSERILGLNRAEVTEKNPIWLTFDDGYKDCIDHVLPGLMSVDARATFYVPTEAIFERKLLDVNKIHILLSCHKTPAQMVKISSEVFNELQFSRVVNESFDDLYRRFGIANLWNDAETEFLKKLFQKILPADLRKQLLAEVFAQVVSRSESSWVDEFYLSPDDVGLLFECGMEVGSHGHSHVWLGDLSADKQRADIEDSFRLLELELGTLRNRTMCYPFGSYDDTTLKILTDLDVNTAVVNDGNKIARIDNSVDRHLELDRIDIMFFDQFIRDEFAATR